MSRSHPLSLYLHAPRRHGPGPDELRILNGTPKVALSGLADVNAPVAKSTFDPDSPSMEMRAATDPAATAAVRRPTGRKHVKNAPST